MLTGPNELDGPMDKKQKVGSLLNCENHTKLFSTSAVVVWQAAQGSAAKARRALERPAAFVLVVVSTILAACMMAAMLPLLNAYSKHGDVAAVYGYPVLSTWLVGADDSHSAEMLLHKVHPAAKFLISTWAHPADDRHAPNLTLYLVDVSGLPSDSPVCHC
jgi:predicted metal-binding membrane protein